MIRRFEALLLVMALLPAPLLATVFSGEVQVAGAQDIFTPPSMSSPVVLRYYIADGTTVKPGDVLLRIDAGQAETELRTLQAQLDQMEAKSAKEIAELELKQADAELALADAQAERDTAAVDAVIPKSLISALDYDRHQGEIERTESALALKRLQVEQAVAAVVRRRQDGQLEVDKQHAALSFYQKQVAGAVVRADHAGTVVHGFDNMFGSGGRYEEGSTSFPGSKVGEVVGEASGYTVQAWVLEPDRVGLRLGQSLQLHVDALPDSLLQGRITSIAGASASREAWGDGRYFEVGIALPAGVKLPLRQGMSVRVDSDLHDEQAHAGRSGAGESTPLKADGEVFAQRSLAISPPSVDGLWQMTVSQMASDGQSVKKGDMLVAFEASDVIKNLTAKRGELAEKRRKQEQLKLDLADRAREAELATAQARAEMEKAQRKADQPKDYIARVDYQKLVVARVKAEHRLKLTAHRQQVAIRERNAEQAMADAEVTALQTEVNKLQESLDALTVKAPRDGIVVHQESWQGGKVDVGSQIWRGQSVAQMPDLSTLAVRAALPERELTRVATSQRVRVLVSGGDRRLSGVIAEVGGTVHSKSRVEAVPVVDLIIHLDQAGSGLKPGQPVQVEVVTPAGAKR
ncbi:HlyD family efflux transporter periplasmic adaptor subunit [Rhodanobacter sp. AS-Z3]|uniref:HlyD family secretion protein n=1 Tax=Rhodanobacter sp. AS-Z3 TaxID=3031330 RepID=UPI0024798003|nr:HlyD family efflux transporter periplasmic adaptor subunit [Rhodanobacter sp. AS-Z3]WEN15898.1 HlyD family efflux transporter periplasmic adaptor subunit [Rhodanobacter sp. AS-Z3]